MLRVVHYCYRFLCTVVTISCARLLPISVHSLYHFLCTRGFCLHEYTLSGSFDRNAFFVEGVSGLKYRCGVSGALPLGFAESARYPQAALERMPSLIEKQQKQIAMLQHEIPTLQEITARKWSKAEELERLKQGCKELQQRIDEALKEAERPQSEVPEEENTVRAA